MLCKEQEQRIKFTVIVANEPNTDQLYLQKSTWFLFTSVSFGTPVSLKVQLNKNTLKQKKFEDTHLFLPGRQSNQYPHVGRRKIQIFPPPGEQDQSNAV